MNGLNKVKLAFPDGSRNQYAFGTTYLAYLKSWTELPTPYN